MTKPKRKVIITCAVTGAIHTPSMSPHLPVTPDEIAEAGIAAAEAGAAISPAHSQSYGDAMKGKAFVESNCARCHAVGLDDDSHMPEALAFRTLHNRYPIDSLAEAFAEGIVIGHPAMPQFELSIDTINDMLAYMKSLAGP